MKNTVRNPILLTLATLGFFLVFSDLRFAWSGNSTPSSSLILTATPSPQITTTPDTELIQQIEVLMIADENCELPCFWGLRPGETTALELLQFIASNFETELYGPELGEDGLEFYELFLYIDPGSFQVVFRIDDDILSKIELRLSESEEWLKQNPLALSELFEEMRTPTDVYMRINPSSPLNYSLAVVYNDTGVMVEYVVVPDKITHTDPIPICPYIDHTTVLVIVWLQAEDAAQPVEDNLRPAPDDTSAYGEYRTLEQMTGFNIEEFTDAFINDTEECVTAFSLDELREMGYR